MDKQGQESNVLIDQMLILNRFPGKGGWTFAEIPGILLNKERPFGWVRVNGSIDGFELNHYHLAPMGNGKLFLPVKKEIRKVIKKEAGDMVHVKLFRDEAILAIPDEFLDCLKDEPLALQFFESITDDEKIKYVKWIYSAKNENVKVQRIVLALKSLSSSNLFHPSLGIIKEI